MNNCFQLLSIVSISLIKKKPFPFRKGLSNCQVVQLSCTLTYKASRVECIFYFISNSPIVLYSQSNVVSDYATLFKAITSRQIYKSFATKSSRWAPYRAYTYVIFIVRMIIRLQLEKSVPVLPICCSASFTSLYLSIDTYHIQMQEYRAW